MSTPASPCLRPRATATATTGVLLGLLVLLATATSACFGARLQTRAPRATAPTPADPRSVVLPDSVAHLPLTLPLAPLVAAIEAALPAHFGLSPDFVAAFRGDTRPARNAPIEDGWAPIGPSDSDLVVRMTAERGPPRARVADGRLHFDTAISWSALPALANDRAAGRTFKACGCDGQAWCGGDRSPPLGATLRHTIRLEADPRGQFVPRVDVALVDISPCQVAVAPRAPAIDIGPLVLAPMIAAATTSVADLEAAANAATSTLSRTLDTLKSAMSEPIPLRNAVIGLRPLRPRIGHFSAIANRDAVVDCHFQIQPVWGTAAAQVLGDPSTGSGDANTPTGFAIVVPVTVPVAGLRDRTAPFLVGRSFSLREHRRADIEDVRIWGAGGRAVVEVVLTGSMPGAVHLVGDMRFDPATGVMQLEHLDYTESSRAAIAQLFDDWQERDLSLKRIVWFDGEGLRKAVHDAARWPLRDAIDAVRAELVAAIGTRDFGTFRFDATLSGMMVANRAMDRDALRLLVTFDGQLGSVPRLESQ